MKIRVVLIIVPLLILALALASGSILMLRLFSLSVLLLLLSFLWVLMGIRDIEGNVKISTERCQVGEWFEEEVNVFNRSKVPKLFLTIEENTNLPVYESTQAFNLSSKSSRSWRIGVYCRRRGQYSLGSLTVTVTDPFGFFSSRRSLGQSQNILICPATLELPFFEPLFRGKLEHGTSSWPINEFSPDAAHVREYADGDTPNRIHWRSTAHTGKLMVKVFDPHHPNYAAGDIWIVADMHQAAQLGSGDETTEEYCVTIVASLIKKYLDDGRQVGLIAQGDQSYLFRPQLSDQHLWSMLETLAVIRAGGQVPVEQLIWNEIGRFGGDSTIIVITPTTSEQIAAPLHNLRNRGNMVIAILLDSSSFGGMVSSANVARGLILGGAQVHIIRRGDGLSKVPTI
jgi:uncharacterized protein (DUF58 family)